MSRFVVTQYTNIMGDSEKMYYFKRNTEMKT